MTLRLLRLVGWVLLTAAACGGAAAPATPADADETLDEILDAEPEASGRACINVRMIRGFDALSDEHLVVTASGRSTYLLFMRRGCIGLDRAMGIAVANNMSRLCSDSRGTVTYRDASRRPMQCRIDNIVEVESKEHARALVGDG